MGGVINEHSNHRKRSKDTYVPVQCPEASFQTVIRRYNRAVRNYNEAIHAFPVSWVAQWLDVEAYRYAEL